MAQHHQQLLLGLAAIACILGVVAADAAPPQSYYIVQGGVYCDTCRAGFETSASEYIAGAKVKVECRHYGNLSVSHEVHGETDSTGKYNLAMVEDRQDQICEVVLLESPLPSCSEIKEGRDRARILITNNNGIKSPYRFANNLGFFTDEPLPICGELLRQYALGDDEQY